MTDDRQFENPSIMVLNSSEKVIIFMKSKRIRWMLYISLCIALWWGVTAAAAESINWRSYEEGLALGKIEKKKVFLHFYADWCGFCVKMAKDTFQNAEVIAYLNANFIPVMVNYDKELETAAKYGVQAVPPVATS